MNGFKIAASLLAANPCCLKQEIDRLEESGVDYVHIDIMDGHFVPNITFGPHIVSELRKLTNLTFDVHLMLDKPFRWLENFIKAGADILTVHAEADEDLYKVSRFIRNNGKKAGLSIKPSTTLKEIEEYIDLFDVFLIMTVEPGWGGQEYIESTTKKIELLKEKLERLNKKIDIEVDGGIKLENIEIPVGAGANVVVAGSGIFSTPNIRKTIKKMRQKLSFFSTEKIRNKLQNVYA